MSAEWETVESGPADADRTVLLIPGGLNAARSYAELMAQPALSGVRLVAVTLPGHAGAPPPEDFSIETYARHAADLAAGLGCDAVLGFSNGATVALEMAASPPRPRGTFSPTGPSCPGSHTRVHRPRLAVSTTWAASSARIRRPAEPKSRFSARSSDGQSKLTSIRQVRD
jgi:pimeloyl-ACP methyl ester carboxylesterase